jgi:hypothetical protein
MLGVSFQPKMILLDIKTANRPLYNVPQFRYLGTTVTNRNLIQKVIKRGFNSSNACYYSVQNILSSLLLTFRICRTIISALVLYGCETRPLTLREEHRLRVFENRVLRRILGPKRDEVTGGWRKLLHDVYLCHV